MPIEGFDYQEFAKALSNEAGQVIPADVSAEDRQYIINIVYQFCFLAGEALFNDTTVSFDAQQACVITQFIGEWAFHKSIDLIKGGIPTQFRDGVMQKVAFTVFEIAKQAMTQKLQQTQMIQVVEHHVKKVFHEALEELKKSGALSEDQVMNAESHSNIDDMAKEMKQNSPSANASDSKILKLAALAMVMRKMPQERVAKMITKFSQEDAQMLIEYIQMEDLENKLDKTIAEKCLREMKLTLPEPRKINFDKVYSKLCNIVKGCDKSQVEVIMEGEREELRKFTLSPFSDDYYGLPARVADIVCEHLQEKIN